MNDFAVYPVFLRIYKPANLFNPCRTQTYL